MIIWGGADDKNLHTGGRYCAEYCTAPQFSGVQSVEDTDMCQTTGIQINWQEPIDWGICATTGTYAIRRYATANCTGSYSMIAANLPSNVASYIETTEMPGNIYYYQIVAT